MGLWLPALDFNRTTAGINGIAGMPMVGINGHLGLLVAMMMIGGRRGQWHSEPKKYFDKSPPPEWDGNHPEKTWRDYRRTLKQWLSTTDVPSEKHGMLLWRALTGDAKLLISHFRDEDLLHWNAGQRIFEVLAQAHKHISEFEDQDDFDNAFYKLHRERNQTLLQFANVARAAYLKHDAYGYPLPDRTKGMIFLRQAKIPGHLEDHIMEDQRFEELLRSPRHHPDSGPETHESDFLVVPIILRRMGRQH